MEPVKRASLTKREKAAMLLAQRGRCAECQGKLMTGAIEFDHTIPVALGNDRKPDSALCRSCHMAKTKGDVRRIAKAVRLHLTFVLGEKKRKRPIKSPGFDKRWRRKVNGETVRRT
jgi:hypothetical protein